MKLKLDKRIKSRKDIFDCFNSEKAEKYIGERGYFANNLSDFSDLVGKHPNSGTLGAIHQDLDSPFYLQESVTVYSFFLPKCLVESEKFSRPFSLTEFKAKLPKMLFPDALIHFRNNENGSEEYALKYNGYIIEDGTTFICLGSREYSLENLFKNGEYLDKDGEWNIFGVEE